MPTVSFEHSQLMILVVSTVVLLLALYPHALIYILSAIALVLSSITALVLFNIILLYIYVKYFLPPNNKQKKQHDFRPLRFTFPESWRRIEERRRMENATSSPPEPSVAPESQEISDAFEELVSYVLRDFLEYWFVAVAGPHEVSFRQSVDRIMRSAVLTLKRRVQDADLTHILVNRLVPIVTAHISDFRAAEIALRGRSLERSVTQSDELDLLLASQFRAGRLHPALTTAAVTTKATEVVHLRKVIEQILPHVIGHKELDSTPVSIIIREIVSCAVLQPVMDMVAVPDFWNQTIDSYLGQAIREQKMVHKLREALNRHSSEMDLDEAIEAVEVPNTPTNDMNGKKSPHSRLKHDLVTRGSLSSIFGDQQQDSHQQREYVGIKMGRRTFQEFLRMIDGEKSLLELKRVRNDIITQIRKKKAQIHDRDPDEIIDGEKVEDVMVYVDRLSVAKKRVDKRIGVLTGDERVATSPFFGGRRKRSEAYPSQPFGYSLADILANPAGLSYFMEFMDRRGDMMKLQFWLIIEGFKNSENTEQGDQAHTTFLQDVNMVYSMYLMENVPHRLELPAHLVADLHKAIKSAQAAIQGSQEGIDATIDSIRLRLYKIQQFTYHQLEKEHFPYFKRSDLYFKYLATTPSSIPEPIPERHSLDETRSIQLVASPESSTDIVPKHLQRTSSVGLAKKQVWDVIKPMSKAGSDTEISIVKQKDGNKAASRASPSPNSRPRGHMRAVSETDYGGLANFLGIGKMVGSANDWWNPSDVNIKVEQEDSHSKKSLEEDGEESMEEDAGSVALETPPQSSPAIFPTEAHEDQLPPPPPRARHPLLRTNTVEAVEAELQSIIDSDAIIYEPEENRLSRSETVIPQPPPLVMPRKHPSSPLLLRDPRGAKSSMALPVQYEVQLQSWNSLNGPNVISEVGSETSESIKSVISNNVKDPADQSNSSGSPVESERMTPASATESNNVHLAPPGDLLLEAKIVKLSEEIDKLIQHVAIVDHLIKKAEAKNMGEKLRVLKKSKSMFRQELQQLKYQKSQYELQESENVLVPDRTKVSITSSTIGTDGSGEFARYVIEIQQLGYDDNYGSGWIVARRYSEFFALHQKLKERYPMVKSLEFPGKWPLLRLQKSFVEARRMSLERYLRRLLESRFICKSEDLRAFLSQQNVYLPRSDQGLISKHNDPRRRPDVSSQLLWQHQQPSSSASTPASSKKPHRASTETGDTGRSSTRFMLSIYKSVAEGIDDLSVEPSMLDFITQRLVGEQFMDMIEEENTDVCDEIKEALPSPLTGDLTETLKVNGEGITSFTEPLCDLFIEMFELKEKNNWLRRQAVVIILQQILGGTIERKIKETVLYLETESMIVYYIRKVSSSLWPNGQSLTFRPPRRADECQQTKEAANRKLSTWLPDMLGQMVGRQNARRGARRLFSVLQNKRLNQDLAYALFDEIVSALFPEVDLSSCKTASSK